MERTQIFEKIEVKNAKKLQGFPTVEMSSKDSFLQLTSFSGFQIARNGKVIYSNRDSLYHLDVKLYKHIYIMKKNDEFIYINSRSGKFLRNLRNKELDGNNWTGKIMKFDRKNPEWLIMCNSHSRFWALNIITLESFRIKLESTFTVYTFETLVEGQKMLALNKQSDSIGFIYYDLEEKKCSSEKWVKVSDLFGSISGECYTIKYNTKSNIFIIYSGKEESGKLLIGNAWRKDKIRPMSKFCVKNFKEIRTFNIWDINMRSMLAFDLHNFYNEQKGVTLKRIFYDIRNKKKLCEIDYFDSRVYNIQNLARFGGECFAFDQNCVLFKIKLRI